MKSRIWLRGDIHERSVQQTFDSATNTWSEPRPGGYKYDADVVSLIECEWKDCVETEEGVKVEGHGFYPWWRVLKIEERP